MTSEGMSVLTDSTALKAFETVAKQRSVRFKDLREQMSVRPEDAQESLGRLEDAKLISSQNAPGNVVDFKTYYITAEGLSAERQLYNSAIVKDDGAVSSRTG